MIAAVLAAVLAAAAPGDDPVRTVAAVQAMYDQSCQVRAYGSYDDLCSALRKQLRDAQKEAARAEKKAGKDKARSAAASPDAPVPTNSFAPAQPSLR